jgi:hypothetical protein
MMDKKDHVIAALMQLNDDLRGKLVNLYADSKMVVEEKEREIEELKGTGVGEKEVDWSEAEQAAARQRKQDENS